MDHSNGFWPFSSGDTSERPRRETFSYYFYVSRTLDFDYRYTSNNPPLSTSSTCKTGPGNPFFSTETLEIVNESPPITLKINNNNALHLPAQKL